MTVLGALLGVALTVGIFVNVIGFPGLFWPFFIFCSIVTLPFALISAGRDSARRREERRADQRHAQELELLRAAIAEGKNAPETHTHIDARSVHIHTTEEKAQKRLFDKP
jgi:hypothetical protein